MELDLYQPPFAGEAVRPRALICPALAPARLALDRRRGSVPRPLLRRWLANLPRVSRARRRHVESGAQYKTTTETQGIKVLRDGKIACLLKIPCNGCTHSSSRARVMPKPSPKMGRQLVLIEVMNGIYFLRLRVDAGLAALELGVAVWFAARGTEDAHGIAVIVAVGHNGVFGQSGPLSKERRMRRHGDNSSRRGRGRHVPMIPTPPMC